MHDDYLQKLYNKSIIVIEVERENNPKSLRLIHHKTQNKSRLAKPIVKQ